MDRLQVLLQMQKIDPFCIWISKWLSNGKIPEHKADLFLHVKGLLYKHITDSHQKFLALMIPKAWKYTVLVEAHDKPWLPESYMDLLFNKMSVLLERHEQGCQEIHSSMCTLSQRKRKSSSLSSTDGKNSRIPLWQNSHWLDHRVWNFQLRQQKHPRHNGSHHRMARSFSHAWQVSRYHSVHIHKLVLSSPYMPQIHTVR